MVTQITKGIKISVKTSFQGTFYRSDVLHYAFSYLISIENLSDTPVQIDARYWEITDSLASVKIVEGEGIVGEQPILQPEESHQYSSGCVLSSSIGAMKGHYHVTDLETNKSFKVTIPSFKLCSYFILN